MNKQKTTDWNQVIETDTLFKDSPDAGDNNCICSRCGKQIKSREVPLRICPGTPSKKEYRYCETCQVNDFGVIASASFDDEEEDYFDDY